MFGVSSVLQLLINNTKTNVGNIKKIIFISSDSDFVPVIKNLEEKGIKTILYTYYEKKRDTNFSRSNYLIKSVNKYRILSKEDLLAAKISSKSENKK